jgi:hypothetical protein
MLRGSCQVNVHHRRASELRMSARSQRAARALLGETASRYLRRVDLKIRHGHSPAAGYTCAIKSANSERGKINSELQRTMQRSPTVVGLRAVLTVIMKGAQMTRRLHWESNLEGLVGMGLLLYMAFAFVVLAR